MRRQPPLTTTTAGGSRRRRGVLASVAVSTLALGVLAAVPAQAAPITVDVYGINDFHGRLEKGSAPTGTAYGEAGAALLAGELDRARAANPNTIFVSSGDNVGASTFTSFIADDQPTLDVLDQMQLDVSAIGNHEFDKGQADLRDRIEREADFDYIAANVVDAQGRPAFTPYTIEDRGGKKIAFIGAVTELMPELVSPAGIEGLSFTDIPEAVNRYATALTNGVPDPGVTGADEADAVVLLVHEGASSAATATADDGSDWAKIAYDVSPEVDAILSAHTHQVYNTTVTPRGGTTPRPIVQTGSYGNSLSHLTFTFDDADVSVKSVTSAPLIDLYRSTATPNAQVAATVTAAVAFANEQGAREIGRVTAPFRRAVQTDLTENRGGESTAGNFVADVQLAATVANGAQLAFMNPGGIRADLVPGADGVVTYRQAAAVQPFANTLVVVDMTGAQIVAALEQQWQPDGAGRPFLKLGASKDLVYTYDPAAARGEHVTSVTLAGAPLDEAATYKVTVNSFLASGSDNFGAFAEGAARADSGKVDLQAQVDYFEANRGVEIGPDAAQRAVGLRATPAPEGGFRAGDEVTLELSSLVFSNDVVPAGPVSVSLDGTELASAPIDATIVDRSDDQGRATLTFTVPEGAAAPAPEVGVAAVEQRQLLVTVGGTGTEVQVPIALAAVEVPPVVEPVPTDPTDPGTPAPGTPAPGTPGTGSGTGAGGTGTAASQGPLAYTGSELASGGLLAALALLLAGAGVLTATRLRRRAPVAAEGTPTD